VALTALKIGKPDKINSYLTFGARPPKFYRRMVILFLSFYGVGLFVTAFQLFNDMLTGKKFHLLNGNFLNPSNSTGLISGLFRRSQMPRNSMVFLFLSQFLIK